MSLWWSEQNWVCKCQGDDPWLHVHREDPVHLCARCPCNHYEPNIPEFAATCILIGPETTEREAQNILLGLATASGAAMSLDPHEAEIGELKGRIEELEEIARYHRRVSKQLREVILQQRFATAHMPQDAACLVRAIMDEVEGAM